MTFPIDTSDYVPLTLDLSRASLSDDELRQLKVNIQIVRDTIIFFTAVAGAKGLGGHTGGAYSIIPEMLIVDGFMRGSDEVHPSYFDEGGHRVAAQYAMSAFNGIIPMEKLLQYREAGQGLYGHPERNAEIGVTFSSGRLGHLWPFVNGIAKAHPQKTIIMFGSDGSQQEGTDAEAARFAVAQNLNLKLFIDDNDITICGHPTDYMPGFDVAKTLEGHGLTVDVGDPEDFGALYTRMQKAMTTAGPIALVNRRPMAPGVPGIEGNSKGHDVIPKQLALHYLEQRGLNDARDYLNTIETSGLSETFLGSTKELGSNRGEFGQILCEILDELPEDERSKTLLVIDSDLEGSTGLNKIHARHPDVFEYGGVMERANYSAAAGFGSEKGRQGVFSTFSAFLEMIISEATMARLNGANLLCHFSHAGIDDMADNTCHFGINVFFADNGLPEGDNTRLYFPADTLQLRAIVRRIYADQGLRYLFTTRSKVPYIQKEDGAKFFDDDYTFEPDKDEVIREGSAGYVVAYGELLYRALDAVEHARADGIDVGLINKPTLNIADDASLATVGATGFALIVEGQNINTGLGSRYGTWLLERGHAPKYAHMGVSRPGTGGLKEHIHHQGIAPSDILAKIRTLAG